MNFWERVDNELKFLGKTRKKLVTAVGFDAKTHLTSRFQKLRTD